MASSGLVKKMLVKPGQRIAVLNAPTDHQAFLGDLPAGVEQTSEPAASVDWVCLFVHNKAEFEQWQGVAAAAVKPDGLFWMAYPKGGAKAKTDLNRDILWKLMEPAGFRPVAMVAIDDIWAAMRFRPAE